MLQHLMKEEERRVSIGKVEEENMTRLIEPPTGYLHSVLIHHNGGISTETENEEDKATKKILPSLDVAKLEKSNSGTIVCFKFMQHRNLQNYGNDEISIGMKRGLSLNECRCACANTWKLEEKAPCKSLHFGREEGLCELLNSDHSGKSDLIFNKSSDYHYVSCEKKYLLKTAEKMCNKSNEHQTFNNEGVFNNNNAITDMFLKSELTTNKPEINLTKNSENSVTTNKSELNLNRNSDAANKPEFNLNKNSEATNKPEFNLNKNSEATNKSEFNSNKNSDTANKPELNLNKNSETTNKPELNSNKNSVTTNKPEFNLNKNSETTNKPEFNSNENSDTADKPEINLNKNMNVQQTSTTTQTTKQTTIINAVIDVDKNNQQCFERISGFSMNGTTTASLEHNVSIEQCKCLCANSLHSRYPFQCASVSYFGDERDCVLNLQNRQSAPEQFTPEPDQQVIYFGFLCHSKKAAEFVENVCKNNLETSTTKGNISENYFKSTTISSITQTDSSTTKTFSNASEASRNLGNISDNLLHLRASKRSASKN
uniref:Apple domain-containing protein n=1 Tax=Meloidogyne incognita TaxID=6306 RepID=A0A914MV36_MELIC